MGKPVMPHLPFFHHLHHLRLHHRGKMVKIRLLYLSIILIILKRRKMVKKKCLGRHHHHRLAKMAMCSLLRSEATAALMPMMSLAKTVLCPIASS